MNEVTYDIIVARTNLPEPSSCKDLLLTFLVRPSTKQLVMGEVRRPRKYSRRQDIIPGFSLSLFGYILAASVNYISPVRQTASGDGARFKRFEYTQYHMSVDVRIVAYATDQNTAERCFTATFEPIAELHTTMIDYLRSSQ